MSDERVLAAIGSLRTDLMAGHESLRQELRDDLAKLQSHVDERINAIEQMVKRITNDHEALKAAKRDHEDRLSSAEAEIRLLKKRIDGLDRDISDADAASRLRDSKADFEFEATVAAMKAGVDELTNSTKAAMQRTKDAEQRAEERERLAEERERLADEREERAEQRELQAITREKKLLNQNWFRALVTLIAIAAAGYFAKHDDHAAHAPASTEEGHTP